MRKVVLFVSIVFMSFSVFAQEWQDVLYLKNGSVIRGVLIEQIPNESVKIQTADGNVFVYQFGDVEKLAKEQKEKKKTERKKYPNRGYRTILSCGVLLSNEERANGVATSMVHGAQISPKLFVGAGLGIHCIDYLNFPFFADIQYAFAKNKISPFMDLRLGARLGYPCSMYISPSVGCRVGHFNLSMGYEPMPNDFRHYPKSGFYNMLAIRFGVDMGAR